MILIDANALAVLLVGLVDAKLIGRHNRTSIYQEQDYYDLLSIIESFDKLIVLPNVWTEVDNLLNDFSGNHKYEYILQITETIKSTSEKYIPSLKATESDCFLDLGLTDSLLLEYSKECKLLVTGDSKLSDYANAYGVSVYDMVKSRNERI
jgi:hypothetical protein